MRAVGFLVLVGGVRGTNQSFAGRGNERVDSATVDESAADRRWGGLGFAFIKEGGEEAIASVLERQVSMRRDG